MAQQPGGSQIGQVTDPLLVPSQVPGGGGWFGEYWRMRGQPRNVESIYATQQGLKGWGHPVANAAYALSDILQRIREERLQRQAELYSQRQDQERQFTAWLASRLSDPDLTEEARSALLRKAQEIALQRAAGEVRSEKKRGFGSVVRQWLEGMTGGPIKKPPELDLSKAIGEMEGLISSTPEFRRSYWLSKAHADLQQELEKLRQSSPGGYAPPSQVNEAIGRIYSGLVERHPDLAQAFLGEAVKLYSTTPEQQLGEAKASLLMGLIAPPAPEHSPAGAAPAPPPTESAERTPAPAVTAPQAAPPVAPGQTTTSASPVEGTEPSVPSAQQPTAVGRPPAASPPPASIPSDRRKIAETLARQMGWLPESQLMVLTSPGQPARMVLVEGGVPYDLSGRPAQVSSESLLWKLGTYDPSSRRPTFHFPSSGGDVWRWNDEQQVWEPTYVVDPTQGRAYKATVTPAASSTDPYNNARILAHRSYVQDVDAMTRTAQSVKHMAARGLTEQLAAAAAAMGLQIPEGMLKQSADYADYISGLAMDALERYKQDRKRLLDEHLQWIDQVYGARPEQGVAAQSGTTASEAAPPQPAPIPTDKDLDMPLFRPKANPNANEKMEGRR